MILPIGIIRIGRITLSGKEITDEITDNHLIDICSEVGVYRTWDINFDFSIKYGY